MRWILLPLAVVVAACGETGAFTIVEGSIGDPAVTDPGDPVDATDTDISTPDDVEEPDDVQEPDDVEDPVDEPDPEPVSANNCGPYVEPGPDELGEVTRVSSGEARLTNTSSNWDFSWTWSGCQADRVFDAQGKFVCEIVYNVEGDLGNGGWGGPAFVYDVTLTPDPATTTCEGAEAQDWLYGIDVTDGLSGTVTLQRVEPGPPGQQQWADFAEAPFESVGDFEEVLFDYSSDFTN